MAIPPGKKSRPGLATPEIGLVVAIAVTVIGPGPVALNDSVAVAVVKACDVERGFSTAIVAVVVTSMLKVISSKVPRAAGNLPSGSASVHGVERLGVPRVSIITCAPAMFP